MNVMNNMKKGLLLGAAWLVFGGGSPAMAIDLYGFASYWDKGDADGKMGIGFGVSHSVFSEHLRLDGRIHFVEKSDLGGGDDLTMVPVDLGAQLHLSPGAPLNPYALGGISCIYADADRTDIDSSFGAYLGGGLEWAPFSMLSVFGELVYRFHELDGGRHGDLDVSGVAGNVGLRIGF